MRYILCLTILTYLTFSCDKKQHLELVELEYSGHFPEYISSPDRNPLTKQGILLGKKLFYDTRLSKTGTVSCASCHLQQLSFADGQVLSKAGASGQFLKRNSPALINLAWMRHFFWDGGVKNLESIPFAALTNPDEMGAELGDIIKFLNSDSEYQETFKQVFGTDSILSAHVARALAQFQRTLISDNSKYDRVQRGEEAFSESELKGLEVFMNKCGSCHTPPLFTDNDFHNNGLDSIFPTQNEDVRAGRYRITLDSSALGKFKTPTLRNLKYTAPYMHDGRFGSLGEVMAHYDSGIVQSPTFDSALHNFSLSRNEQELLQLFLETLTDDQFNRNPDFSSLD